MYLKVISKKFYPGTDDEVEDFKESMFECSRVHKTPGFEDNSEHPGKILFTIEDNDGYKTTLNLGPQKNMETVIYIMNDMGNTIDSTRFDLIPPHPSES